MSAGLLEFIGSRRREPERPSDLKHLRDWAVRLRAWAEDQDPPPPNRLFGMLYLPHRLAKDAMMRLSVRYPLIIKQLEEHADFANARLAELERAGGAENLEGAMSVLLERIEAAVGVIEQADAERPTSTVEPHRLTPTQERAHQSYAVAEAAGAETDDAAYDHIDLHGCPQYESVVLPTRDTWKRQLRRARRKLGERKNTPRAGRTGRSIAGPGR